MTNHRDTRADADLHARADAGDPSACMQLARRLMRGRGETRDYERAVYYFDLAARAGEADALYMLGKCYLKGLGCLRDPAGGVSCLERAAERGHAAAALKLGDCFARGVGAPVCLEMAAYWYRKAAALGEPHAQDGLLHLAQGGEKR